MRAALLCLLLACGGTAAPPPAPTVRSRVPELDYFVGTWSIAARDPSSGRSFTLRYVIEPALGGAWLSGHGISRERGLEIRDYWGRDPVAGGLVRIIFQSDGTVATVRSPGWTRNLLVFEGEARVAGGGAATVRETITPRGRARFDAVWEAKTDTGWSPYSIERLTRQ
jgi:hypothetical protein